MKNDVEKKIGELSDIIRNILEICFERIDYFFSDLDKKCIKSFKKNIFSKGIDNIENIPQFQEALKIIIKIINYSIKGRVKDDKFICELFPRKEIIDELVGHVKKIYFPKKELNENDICNLDNILCDLVNISLVITPEIEEIINFLEEKGVNLVDTEFMETFMRRFTEGRFLIQSEYSQKSYELAYKYIDLVTKQRDFNYFNNQSVSDVLQIIKQSSDDIEKKFLGIIHKNLKINEVDIDKVEERIKQFKETNSNNTIINKEELDSFLRDVAIVKIYKNNVIDLEIVKMIFSQLFKDNSVIAENKGKYVGVLQRMIESISEDDLQKYGIERICVFRSDFGQKMSAGLMIPGFGINILNTQSIEALLEGNLLDMITSIYHENTHEIQYFEINNGQDIKNNALRVLQLKEEIIKKYNPEYYIANYTLMFQEIEARERGYTKCLEFINDLNIDCFEELKEQLKNKIAIEKANYTCARFKKKSINSQETISIDIYFNELIKDHPEIISNYPMLFVDCEIHELEE